MMKTSLPGTVCLLIATIVGCMPPGPGLVGLGVVVVSPPFVGPGPSVGLGPSSPQVTCAVESDIHPDAS